MGATIDPTSHPRFAKVCCTTFEHGSKIVEVFVCVSTVVTTEEEPAAEPAGWIVDWPVG